MIKFVARVMHPVEPVGCNGLLIDEDCTCFRCANLIAIALAPCKRCKNEIGFNRIYEVERIPNPNLTDVEYTYFYHLSCWERTCQERELKQA